MATASVIPPNIRPGDTTLSAMWFQRILDAIRRYHPVAGKNISLTETPNGTIINSIAGASEQRSRSIVRPFSIRWQTFPKSGEEGSDGDDTTDKGEWQIYLPFGCLSVNDVLSVPDNELATDENGNKIADWYKIQDPEDSDADVKTVNNKLCAAWAVTCIVQPWPRFKVTTKLSDAQFGDGFKKIVVGTIGRYEETTGEGQHSATQTIHTVAQSVSSVQNLVRDVSSRFAIEYRANGNIYQPGATFSPYVVNQTITFGRFEASVSADTKIDDDAKHVVLHIKHDSETFSIEVLKIKSANNDDNTYLTLYDLDNGVVKSDYRSVLDNLPFYNN